LCLIFWFYLFVKRRQHNMRMLDETSSQVDLHILWTYGKCLYLVHLGRPLGSCWRCTAVYLTPVVLTAPYSFYLYYTLYFYNIIILWYVYHHLLPRTRSMSLYACYRNAYTTRYQSVIRTFSNFSDNILYNIIIIVRLPSNRLYKLFLVNL